MAKTPSEKGGQRVAGKPLPCQGETRRAKRAKTAKQAGQPPGYSARISFGTGIFWPWTRPCRAANGRNPKCRKSYSGAGGPNASQRSTNRFDLRVVLRLRPAVGIATAAEPPQVAVEARADVPELVRHRGQLLPERQIEEPRQVEVQNVEHFAAALVHPLQRPPLAATNGVRCAAGEAQRHERGVHAAIGGAAGLREADGDHAHVDVAEFLQAEDHVLAELPTCGR